MSRTIHLADGMSLPLDIVTMRSLVLGVSGSGKSTFGRLLAERIHHAGQRFCVIDLKHDWWGLKSSADGKRPGISVVVIGGPRADIPLDEHAGAGVADIVAEIDHSVILDLDSLPKKKQIKFLYPFLERLYDVNREPLLLICDEADRYAPQKPMSTEAHDTLGAADDIARRGRKRGIGSLWLSQRPAVINKNVTSQCELTATFRTTSSLDLKELKEHIGRVGTADQVEEIIRQVGGLADGQAILLSQHPRMRMFKTVQFPMPETFDSSATPSVGQRRKEPKQLAAPDLAALGERIKAAIEKAKAEDPRELRKRVAELEAELKKTKASKTPAPAATKVQRVEVPVVGAKERTHLESIMKRIEAFRAIGVSFDVASQRLSENLRRALQVRYEPPIDERTAQVVRPGVKAIKLDLLPDEGNRSRRAPLMNGAEQGTGELPAGALRILGALATFHPTELSRVQVATLSGIAPRGGTFSTYLSKLKTRGLIDTNGSTLKLIGEGVNHPPDQEIPSTPEELATLWDGHMAAGARAMLREVLKAGEKGISRDELGERTGIATSGGTFSTYLSKLTSNGLVERRGRDIVPGPAMDLLR